MNDFILERKIAHIIKGLNVDDFVLDYEERTINPTGEAEQVLVLKQDCLYFFSAEQADIPEIALVTVKSENNFIRFTKETFKSATYGQFLRGYAKVKYPVSTWIPFRLKFIVARPLLSVHE